MVRTQLYYYYDLIHKTIELIDVYFLFHLSRFYYSSSSTCCCFLSSISIPFTYVSSSLLPARELGSVVLLPPVAPSPTWPPSNAFSESYLSSYELYRLKAGVSLLASNVESKWGLQQEESTWLLACYHALPTKTGNYSAHSPSCSRGNHKRNPSHPCLHTHVTETHTHFACISRHTNFISRFK